MKSLINRALLKEQLKRFWVIAALPFLAYMLFVFAPLHRMPADAAGAYAYGTAYGLINMLKMANPVFVIASAVVPLVAALSLFSYLFNPRAAVAFNSYPVNRKQLFFTNLFAGLGLMLVPLLIFGVFLLIPIRLQVSPDTSWFEIPASLFPNGVADGEIINTFPVVFAFICRLVITYTFYFAVFALASVLAGHGVVAVLLCAALPFAPIGVFALDQSVKYWMVAGYSLNKLGDMIGNVLMYSNPLGWFMAFEDAGGGMGYVLNRVFSAVSGNFTMGNITLVLTYVATTAVLLTGAYFLSRARKPERTGESVVFGPFKQVLIFLLSLTGGIIMFVVFLNVINMGTVRVAYVGFVLGFIFAFFIAQMVAEKTFNVGHKFKTLLKFGAFMAAAYLLVFVSTRFDLNGYQRYVPSADSVAGVYVMDYPDEESFDNSITNSGWVNDKDLIEETVAAHKSTISNMPALRQMLGLNLMGTRTVNGEIIRVQNIFYKLKNGETVSRTYYLSDSMFADNGWESLRDDERNILSDYQMLSHPEAVKTVHLYYRENSEIADEKDLESITDAGEIASLFSELKKDAVATARTNTADAYRYYAYTNAGEYFIEDKAVDNYGYISLNMELVGPDNNAPGTTRSGMYLPDAQYSLHLSEYEHTLGWLEGRGYMK